MSSSNSFRSHRWSILVVVIVLLSFAAGLLASRFAGISQINADQDRVFELRIYHAVPGKLPALESRFRDTTSKLIARHHLDAVGYWVPEDSPDSDPTFIYLLAHSSREAAKQNWDAMRSDPDFQAMVKSEQADKLVEKVDSIYMRPSDFSPMK
jgi:hypothetical protein